MSDSLYDPRELMKLSVEQRRKILRKASESMSNETNEPQAWRDWLFGQVPEARDYTGHQIIERLRITDDQLKIARALDREKINEVRLEIGELKAGVGPDHNLVRSINGVPIINGRFLPEALSERIIRFVDCVSGLRGPDYSESLTKEARALLDELCGEKK